MALPSEFDRSRTKASIRGDYFADGQGKNTPALVRVAGQTLIITDFETGKLIKTAALDDTSVSDRLGNVARRITLSNGDVFVTHDNDGVDRFIGANLSSRSVIWLEKFHPRMIVLCALAIGLIAGIYQYGLPVIATGAAMITPNSVTKTIAQGSLAGIDGTLLLPSKLDDVRKQELTAEFEHLVAHTSERTQSFKPKLLFRSFRLGPNAFALPDGTIVLTDELANLVSNKAIVGVLGHELGHVEELHSLKKLYRSVGIFAMIGIVAGDVGGILEELLLSGAGLLELSYSREFEREADAYGVALLKRANREPAGLVIFFEKLQAEQGGSGDTSWLSTHPATKERVETLKKLIEE